jgi:methionyl-tRNA formyltransferase
MFAGTPAVALPALETLLASPHEVVAVITRPDAAAGRGRVEATSPIARRAVAAGLDVLKPAKPSEPQFLDRLRELAPDCIAVVAYGALVPQTALDIPARGWVNLHFSLLPAWRGAAPLQHAILHGDEITGATTFLLEAGLDTGPVLGVVTEEIRPRDTAGELLGRLSVAGAGLLAATMDGLAADTLRAIPQSPDGVSLAPKVTPADARVDWSASAMRVDRLVRACTPAPGAWTTFRGRRLKLGPVVPISNDDSSPSVSPESPLSPGELAQHAGALPGVLAGTGTTAVLLGTVQPEGKAAMPAVDWARGARLTTEDRFV